MEEKVKEILADILGLSKSDVGAKTSAQSVPVWDSLRQIEIVAAIEDDFDVTLSIDEIESMTSFPEILKTLEEKAR